MSDKPEGGYDTGTLAGDLVALMDELAHQRFAVVGHGTGFAISYALAADHPDRVDRLALAENPRVPVPAPPLFLSRPLNDRLWHLGFNRIDQLNEQLVQGREDAFFRWEFDAAAKRLPDDVINYYVRLLSNPDSLRGSLEMLAALTAFLASYRDAAAVAASKP
ncbi:MAG TPA: alpha/beta fold hydrolase [Jiangellales bacterium]|nr:alpha/beta fold hydrolase [Jiangellales bacterium]